MALVSRKERQMGNVGSRSKFQGVVRDPRRTLTELGRSKTLAPSKPTPFWTKMKTTVRRSRIASIRPPAMRSENRAFKPIVVKKITSNQSLVEVS